MRDLPAGREAVVADRPLPRQKAAAKARVAPVRLDGDAVRFAGRRDRQPLGAGELQRKVEIERRRCLESERPERDRQAFAGQRVAVLCRDLGGREAVALAPQIHHRIVIDAARIGNAEQQRRLGTENVALAVEPEVRGQYEAPGDRQIEVIEPHLVDAALAGFDARVATSGAGSRAGR
jgi:hypothetical protein